MITTSLNMNNTAPSNIAPEWYSSERYDYCETPIRQKKPTMLERLEECLKNSPMSRAGIGKLSPACR